MLKVTSIGAVVPDTTHHGVNLGKPILYPDGFAVERAVFVAAGAPAASKVSLAYKDPTGSAAAAPVASDGEPYFTGAIHWVDGQPNFSVSRSDRPVDRTYTDTLSATTVWRKALEDAEADFPSRAAELQVPRNAKGRFQISGIRLYGLHMREVIAELASLPGGQAALDAAVAAAAATASSATAAPSLSTAELDGQSTSLLSAPGSRSQSQSNAKRSRAVSPEPKASTKAKPSASSAARGSKSRATTSRPASVETVPSSAGVSVISIGDTQPLAEAALLSPVKTKRRTAAKKAEAASAEASAPAAADEGSGAAAAPAKRRRTSSRKRIDDADASTPAAAPAPAAPSSSSSAARAVVLCPDCGLAGTPFCATTGRPHLPPPCSSCGLTTAFCPITGEPHAGTVLRENRQRGEVHLPGATRKPRRRLSAGTAGSAAPPAGAMAEVTVVSTQDGNGADAPGSAPAASASSAADTAGAAKKPRRKRARAEGEEGQAASVSGAEPGGEGAATTTARDGAAPEKAGRGRRPRKTKSGDTAAAAADAAVTEGTAPADGAEPVRPAEAVAAPPPPPPPPAEEPAYTYPPLRPPLTTRERNKAVHLLQEGWKAQYGDGPVLPPAVAAVPLALVPARRPAATQRGKKGRGSGGAGGGGAPNADEDEEAEETGQPHPHADGEAGAEEGDDREPGKSGLSSAVGSPASTTIAALPSMVHPLEVTQFSTSAAGKRLSRFLVQYTSERTLFDLLRNAAAAAGATAGAGRKPGKAGTSATATAAGTAAASTEAGAAGEAEHIGDTAEPLVEGQERMAPPPGEDGEADAADVAVPAAPATEAEVDEQQPPVAAV